MGQLGAGNAELSRALSCSDLSPRKPEPASHTPASAPTPPAKPSSPLGRTGVAGCRCGGRRGLPLPLLHCRLPVCLLLWTREVGGTEAASGLGLRVPPGALPGACRAREGPFLQDSVSDWRASGPGIGRPRRPLAGVRASVPAEPMRTGGPQTGSCTLRAVGSGPGSVLPTPLGLRPHSCAGCRSLGDQGRGLACLQDRGPRALALAPQQPRGNSLGTVH